MLNWPLAKQTFCLLSSRTWQSSSRLVLCNNLCSCFLLLKNLESYAAGCTQPRLISAPRCIMVDCLWLLLVCLCHHRSWLVHGREFVPRLHGRVHIVPSFSIKSRFRRQGCLLILLNWSLAKPTFRLLLSGTWRSSLRLVLRNNLRSCFLSLEDLELYVAGCMQPRLILALRCVMVDCLWLLSVHLCHCRSGRCSFD